MTNICFIANNCIDGYAFREQGVPCLTPFAWGLMSIRDFSVLSRYGRDIKFDVLKVEPFCDAEDMMQLMLKPPLMTFRNDSAVLTIDIGHGDIIRVGYPHYRYGNDLVASLKRRYHRMVSSSEPIVYVAYDTKGLDEPGVSEFRSIGNIDSYTIDNKGEHGLLFCDIAKCMLKLIGRACDAGIEMSGDVKVVKNGRQLTAISIGCAEQPVMRYGIAAKGDMTIIETGKEMNTKAKNHTLTIVMICHNDVSHLKRSISKIKDTIQPGVRLLFVDDHSDDGSFELATALVEGIGTAIQTPRIMNVGGARNFGIEYLNSLPADERPEYIWFHDCDDYISDDGIKRVMDALRENDGVDCISVPIATLRNAMSEGRIQPTLYQSAVAQTSLYDAANSPVGAWSKVFKLSKNVPQAENQMCEHVAWHYKQFDQFDSWAKVAGETPCYIWDRTNDKAISETVDFCNNNSNTIEGLAFSNMLVQRGLKDRWVSDCLRNLANMYDVRHELKKPYVRDSWAIRFRQECANVMGGHFVH